MPAPPAPLIRMMTWPVQNVRPGSLQDLEKCAGRKAALPLGPGISIVRGPPGSPRPPVGCADPNSHSPGSSYTSIWHPACVQSRRRRPTRACARPRRRRPVCSWRCAGCRAAQQQLGFACARCRPIRWPDRSSCSRPAGRSRPTARMLLVRRYNLEDDLKQHRRRAAGQAARDQQARALGRQALLAFRAGLPGRQAGRADEPPAGARAARPGGGQRLSIPVRRALRPLPQSLRSRVSRRLRSVQRRAGKRAADRQEARRARARLDAHDSHGQPDGRGHDRAARRRLAGRGLSRTSTSSPTTRSAACKTSITTTAWACR